ncbi:MAG: hypothetical protein JNK64_01405 [Myxococcales bacterium]|nr:hypothetical protein [Myxococcales bacterium]
MRCVAFVVALAACASSAAPVGPSGPTPPNATAVRVERPPYLVPPYAGDPPARAATAPPARLLPDGRYLPGAGAVEATADEIAGLEDMLARTAGHGVGLYLDSSFRLGWAYAELQRWLLLRATDATLAPAEADGYRRRAEQAQRRAIEVLTKITQQFPSYAKADDAVMMLAQVLTDAGQPDRALDLYARIMRDPHSRWIAEAHLLAAELELAAGVLPAAEQLYGEASRFPQSWVSAYAYYDLAWMRLERGDAAGAQAAFAHAVHATTSQLGLDEIRAAAANGYARAYAVDGAAAGAPAAFAAVSAADAPAMLEAAMVRAAELGRQREVIDLAGALAAARPDDVAACRWHAEAAYAALALDDRPAAATALAATASANRASGACADATRALLGHTARAWHRDAVARGDAAAADLALGLYDLYLDGFAAAPDRAETLVAAAELAWHRAALAPTPALWTAAAARFEAAAMPDVAAHARARAGAP